MDTGLAVVLAATAAAVSPLLLSRLNAKQANAIQVANYARQDLVAARAAEVAEQAAEAARLLVERDAEVARLAKLTAANIDGKLDVIHTLVNSTLTGALEGQLLALRQLLARDEGRPLSAEEITSAETRIGEVQSQLADRMRQTEIAEEQQKGTPTKTTS